MNTQLQIELLAVMREIQIVENNISISWGSFSQTEKELWNFHAKSLNLKMYALEQTIKDMK